MRRRRRTSSTILAAALISAPLAAQSRNTVLVGPPALGAICYVRQRRGVCGGRLARRAQFRGADCDVPYDVPRAFLRARA